MPVHSSWPFGDFKPFGYSVLLADPAWYFKNYSEKGEEKNPVAHYECMSLEKIKNLPVAHLAAPNSVLFMWATAPMLPDAIDTMRAWGFTYKTAGAWAKRSKTNASWAFGTGYILRSAAEFYIVGTIGNPKTRSRRIRNLIVAPIREHSRKPCQMRVDIEELYAGPKIELFARERHPGWDAWGNESDKFAGQK